MLMLRSKADSPGDGWISRGYEINQYGDRDKEVGSGLQRSVTHSCMICALFKGPEHLEEEKLSHTVC